MRSTKNPNAVGYLPNETPSPGKLLVFSLQQFITMFPATVLAALLMGFHTSTALFASGVATIATQLVTKSFSKDKTAIPLYYGSSFSFIAAVAALTGVKAFGEVAPDALIGQAQFGIIMAGVASALAGLLVARVGMAKIEKVLPPSVTGSVALIVGGSLFVVALNNASGYDAATGLTSNIAWIAALITLLSTVLFSVFLKGVWQQSSILLGIGVGFLASIPMGLVDFSRVAASNFITTPHFTAPVPSIAALLAIMPIAIATIPESTAHLFQIDLYVDKLAEEKQSRRKYNIKNKLWLNLVADGIGDIVAALFGGPAGTNYGENIAVKAISKVFSNATVIGAALLAIASSFIGPVNAFVNSIPAAVINGACIYLFGVIAVQGVALMIEKKVNIFDGRNAAVIAVVLVVGLGGSYAFAGNGMIPFFGAELPAIATAAIAGIVLNLILNIGRKEAPENVE